MIFFIFNLIGLGIIAISFIISFQAMAFLPAANETMLPWLIMGCCFFVFDSVIRFFIIKKYYKKSKLKGGTLFFIPLFIWGIFLILISLINLI